MPAKKDMPATIRRSGATAQRTWAKAHDSAVGTYGEGERAHRTAFSALKHTHEKVEDHWETKSGGRTGPSDEQAAKSTPTSGSSSKTAGGVDANAPKSHLRDLARKADISGRSRMSKQELVEALRKANNRATARARR